MKALTWTLVLLCSCAPTYTAIVKAKRCPVPTTLVLADFFTGLGLGAVSGLKSNAGKDLEGTVYGAGATLLLSGALVSEIVCRD